jgi:hypothetical protein
MPAKSPTSKSKPDPSALLSEEAISTRAYFLWEADGRPDGRGDHYWGLAHAEATKAFIEATGTAVAKATKGKSANIAPAEVKATKATKAKVKAEGKPAKKATKPRAAVPKAK